jgi:hypothetical protein
MDECALVKPGERIEAVRDACHRWADAVHAAIFGADADFLAA